MILEARDLTVRYPDATRPAVSGVSLQVAEGRLVALAGPNGSGKTTLMRALLGVLPHEAGTVLVDGRPLAGWARNDLARVVGVVPQREMTWLPLTVEETVLLGRYPHLGALSPVTRADRDAIRSALERCDAWQFRQRGVEALSGGESQRVRIARALAQEPRVLVLDEPGSALDIRHEMEVMELVRQLVDGGIACLVITHHLNLAARYADTVAVMDEGHLVAAGTPGDIITEDLMTRVFRWPVAIRPWHDGTPQVVPLRPGESAG
jgi:iron complex transport system ATP-binding protein